jgi:hypothetical protein
MTPEVIVDSRSGLANVFVRRFEAVTRNAVAARGRFTCALPGGSMAGLARTLLPRAGAVSNLSL